MDPTTGTFTTMDTYGGSLTDPMSLHKYLFANSNPVRHCDPSGHFSMSEQMLVCGLIGEFVSSTLYIVELCTTDNIKYDSWQSALLGSLNVAVAGFAAGVFFCALHIVFAALVGTAIAAIVFGAFGVAMSILGMLDGGLDWENGDTDLGTVKVLLSIISLTLSLNSVSSGITDLSFATETDIYAFQSKNNPGKPGGARPRDFGVNDNTSSVPQYPTDPKNGKIMGASTCLDPDKAPLTGDYFKIPKGTALPNGMGWHQDSSNHGVLFPTEDTTVERFNDLYNSLPWRYVKTK